MTTKTKSNPFKAAVFITYTISALKNLIDLGKIQRKLDFGRVERNLAKTVRHMVGKGNSNLAKVVKADSDTARNALGRSYCEGRLWVAIITNLGKLKEVGLTDPRTWLGSCPMIGRFVSEDGKDTWDEINAGTHRSGGLDLVCADFTQGGYPLDPSKIKVQVQLVEGEMARHGQSENVGREDDTSAEHVDNLFREWKDDPSERREHFELEGFGKKKGIHHAHRIFRLIFGFIAKLPKAVKLYDPETGKDTTEVKGTDFIAKPGEKYYGEVDGVEAVGKRLKAHYQVSLDVAKIGKVEDLPASVTDAWPFRLTYSRVASLCNAVVADCYEALSNDKVMKLTAELRPNFKATWEAFSNLGWAKSASNGSTSKPVANKGAADQVRLMAKGKGEAAEAIASKVAGMFETGKVTPALLDIIEAAANPVSSADFFAEIDERLAPESKQKVTEAEANEAAREAVKAVYAR